MENDHGWLNYYIMPSGIGYLENFYVYPSERQAQNGTYLLSMLELEMKELRGIDFYYTTINRKFGDADKTLQICLKRGFKFHASNDEGIILKKEF